MLKTIQTWEIPWALKYLKIQTDKYMGKIFNRLNMLMEVKDLKELFYQVYQDVTLAILPHYKFLQVKIQWYIMHHLSNRHAQ